MFYITISNGLIQGDHRKRMGTAVWEFMWCIDKVTRIDDDGLGWVLGGKPIKLDDLAKNMGVSRDTVSENLAKLEQQGYITKLLTPYGIVIKVCKTKKKFGKRGSEKTPNLYRENPEPRRENPEPNKTLQETLHTDTQALPEWLDKSAWNEWLKYKKETRKKLTTMMISRQLKILEDNKKDQIEIIENSISHGWTGLFPIFKKGAELKNIHKNSGISDVMSKVKIHKI